MMAIEAARDVSFDSVFGDRVTAICTVFSAVHFLDGIGENVASL